MRDLQNTNQNNSGDETKPVISANDSVSHSKLEDLKRDLEEQRELANNRLTELELLNKEHKVLIVSFNHNFIYNLKIILILGYIEINGKVQNGLTVHS